MSDRDTAAAKQLFEKMNALSNSQTKMLAMFNEVLPALLAEQREMRSAVQQLHAQLLKLTAMIEGRSDGNYRPN
jgi:hypothetical protein